MQYLTLAQQYAMANALRRGFRVIPTITISDEEATVRQIAKVISEKRYTNPDDTVNSTMETARAILDDLLNRNPPETTAAP